MKEGNVSSEEEKQEGEPRLAKVRNVEVRPRNWLVPVILVTLRQWNSYGYELMERVADFGFEAINPGTLYRTLRQMDKEGLCESKWEASSGGGPARRVYSITDAGEAYLDFWAEALEQYQRNMDIFFRLYIDGPARRDQQKNDD
jgi:PadR family transcriptional regulator, regulatory protein PadR